MISRRGKRRLILIISLGLMGVAGYYAWRALLLVGCCRSCMEEAVRIAADSDQDGTTSKEEWTAAYREAGATWDGETWNSRTPLKLSVDQLRAYLDEHWPPPEKVLKQ